jgi:DNA-directed RNA polymerase
MREQIALEERMLLQGISRYHKNLVSSQPSQSLSGIALMKRTVSIVEDAITQYLEEAFAGKSGRGMTSAKLMNMVKPDVAAYIALKVTLDHLSGNNGLTATAMSIAGILEDEFKFDLFKDKERRLYEAVKSQVSKRTSNRHYMRYNLIHSMHKNALITYEPWTRTEKLHLGCKLLDIIVQTTGLIRKSKEGTGRRSKLIVLATEDTIEWIKKVNAQGEILSPAYSPCIIPPKPWKGAYTGGYWSKHLKPLPLVKTTNRLILEEIDNHEMPLEYKAINALQDTKWDINKKVLSVLMDIWELGGGWAGIPPRDSVPIPTCPLPKALSKRDMDEGQLETLTNWKRQASLMYQKNAKMGSKRLNLVRTIAMAKEYLNKNIYFVYQNDFRGRKYAVSSFVNPQGTDYSKALLVFGKGKPISTPDALHWLRIQGSNTFGNDKVPFDEREQWVIENEENILQSAANPLDFKWWTEASDPFQFLAFCFEYQGFTWEGWGFISTLPIALDGRNNGLQHLSALGLDTVGGKATCLIPSEKPEDIYQTVYEMLFTRVNEAAKDGEYYAHLWMKFGGSRSLVKRPLMTLAYGSTRFSCSEYIMDYVNDCIDEGQENVFGDDTFKAVTWLSGLLWDTANSAVPSAKKIMGYLQSVARVLSNNNLPVIWKTPTEFWVHQMYPDTVARRITTHIDGVLIKPQVREDNFLHIDKRRAVNGAAPNFVHGLDESHMTLTICKGVDVGMDSFAVVHDEYAVHAADTTQLGRLIRESFVEIYREDWLEKYAAHAREVCDDVPDPPEKGELDIEDVLNSKYFFA